MAVHDIAARGFGAGADEYERGRPSYPAGAVALLAGELGLGPGATVVDLGAGTGKLTRLLVPTGARVVAVEPVAAMRAKLAEAVPLAEVLEGTAEAIPLPDGSADAAVAAQAFHWFDGPRALAEIARVLRPGGRLGLVWNVRDESVPWVRRLTEVIDPYEGGVPRYRTGRWRDAFAATAGAFGPLAERRFRNDQETDPDGVVERVASMSFVAALPEDERAGVLAQVRALVEELGPGVTLPHRVDVYWCSKR